MKLRTKPLGCPRYAATKRHTARRTRVKTAAENPRKTAVRQKICLPIEKLPDGSARRNVRERTDNGKSAGGSSNRFRPVRSAIVNCQKHAIRGVRRNG